MTIHDLALPGIVFADAEAFHENRAHALAYEAAVAAYAIDGCEASLWEALSALGFDYAEIQRHVDNRGWRMSQSYA